MEYKKHNNRILICLEKGDEIMDSITRIAIKENIGFSSLTGIGTADNVELGFFNLKDKEYKRSTFEGEYELTSLIGNVTMKDGKQFVHIHVNISDQNYKVYGGHLFNANILATAEIVLEVLDTNITRNLDDNIGLHFWNLSSCK
tara:strand:- start:95 stop:526 length:432 start_codon:yes stop_codon:yes gene_type:complete